MNEKKIAYQILEECKTGPEEFFVLVSSIDYEHNKELAVFSGALVSLVEQGYLRCDRDDEEGITITLEEIKNYVKQRLDAGEKLDEYPEICEEYTFMTTEKGIQILEEGDRPINLKDIN